jgi:hypothetical protein
MQLKPTLGLPRRQLLGTRTTRMLSIDLFDCEREIAGHTTEVFNSSNVSYPRNDLEISMFSDVRSVIACPPREEFEPHIGAFFPNPIGRIDSLWNDRRQILLRLANRSLNWRLGLNDMAGGVSLMTWGETGKTERIGQPADSVRWLSEDPDAFPEPAFTDAMFSDDVMPEDVTNTREYRHLQPWFLDDVDEELVARWYYEHTGSQPWGGSWNSYELNSTPEDEWEDWMHAWNDHVQSVVSVAELVAERRMMLLAVDPNPKQLILQLQPERRP